MSHVTPLTQIEHGANILAAARGGADMLAPPMNSTNPARRRSRLLMVKAPGEVAQV